MSARFNADGEAYTRTLSLGSQANFSFTGWVKISVDRNAFSAMFSLDDGSASSRCQIFTDSGGTNLVLFNNIAGSVSLASLAVGTWCFVGISSGGTSGRYVIRADGSGTFTTGTFTNSATTTLTNFRIGDSTATNQWFDGCAAAVKLWTGAALTQAELEAESWTYTPARTSNLYAWYPLQVAETTDYSGNGRTLSGGSGTTTEAGPSIPYGTSFVGWGIPI